MVETFSDMVAHAAVEPLPPPDTPPALQALCLIARLHGLHVDPPRLARELRWPADHAPSVDELQAAAACLGASSDCVNVGALIEPRLLPALALLGADPARPHVVLLAQCDGERVLYQDPSGRMYGGSPVIAPLTAFLDAWPRRALLRVHVPDGGRRDAGGPRPVRAWRTLNVAAVAACVLAALAGGVALLGWHGADDARYPIGREHLDPKLLPRAAEPLPAASSPPAIVLPFIHTSTGAAP